WWTVSELVLIPALFATWPFSAAGIQLMRNVAVPLLIGHLAYGVVLGQVWRRITRGPVRAAEPAAVDSSARRAAGSRVDGGRHERRHALDRRLPADPHADAAHDIPHASVRPRDRASRPSQEREQRVNAPLQRHERACGETAARAGRRSRPRG